MIHALRTRPALATALAVSLLACAGSSRADDAPAAVPRTPAPEGARVYIISPSDGATVSSPVLVRFGLSGMGVAPAGVANPNTGHHHLIIDAPTPPAAAPIPNDAHHKHFGGGQTETTVELAPGTHTLQLVLGDALHVPHDPPIVSEVVTIRVE
ncbi:MAG: DUF4399 domain-containing protein [Myxococcales bacterium]|nr:DUF4399 domain-containing protein [Myxococcales bacterium]